MGQKTIRQEQGRKERHHIPTIAAPLWISFYEAAIFG
jgi:hypothetical protein